MVTYYSDKGIGVVEFDDLDSNVNLLSQRNLDALKRIIDNAIEKDAKRLKALFFISKKGDVFIAGADIKELAVIRTKEEALELCKKGQELFNKIEALTMPTFAVINGACVGGGLELALACDYILATKNKNVRFGFPEVRLGIVPGFGGSHRLRERVGAKKADELINTGKQLNAMEAKRLSIVDRIIPASKQFAYKELLKRQYRPRRVRDRAEFEQKEREILAERILKKPARNALSSFLLVSKYRGSRCSGGKRNNIASLKRCAVIGGGTMGKGIAYLISAETGLKVDLRDANKLVLRKAKPYIKDIYKDAVNRGLLCKDEAISKLENMSFDKMPLRHADIIIESITEDALLKKGLFVEIEKELREDSIVATNTSCISVKELSRSFKHAERFLGVHFFNPAYKMKLVEVIPTKITDRTLLMTTINLLHNLRRIPIIVKDSPGFLVNRMVLPYLNEAVFMLQEGVPPKDIEASMLNFGMPMGPLKLIKEIGKDVVHRASKILEESFGTRMKAADISQGLTLRDIKPARLNLKEKDIINRLLHPIRREALFCLDERVVDNRESIDLALLLGIGFPRTKRIWKK